MTIEPLSNSSGGSSLTLTFEELERLVWARMPPATGVCDSFLSGFQQCDWLLGGVVAFVDLQHCVCGCGCLLLQASVGTFWVGEIASG